MYGRILQDWTTVTLAPGQDMVQPEADLLSFEPFQDIVFWLDVRGIRPGDNGSVAIAFETSPTKDESDFYLMQTQDPLTLGVAVLPVLTISLPGGVPLSKWVRWHLYHSGAGTTIDYGATFRILCAANAVGTI